MNEIKEIFLQIATLAMKGAKYLNADSSEPIADVQSSTTAEGGNLLIDNLIKSFNKKQEHVRKNKSIETTKQKINLSEVKSMLIKLEIKGSIRQRKSGRLELRTQINKKQVSIYGADIAEIQANFLKTISQGGTRPCNRTKKQVYLYAFSNDWLETFKKPYLKESSYKSIKYCLSGHIKKIYDDKPLRNFTLIDLEKGLNKIPTTRMRLYAQQIIKEIFRKATELKYIKDNPAVYLQKVKHVEKVGKALTQIEEANFKIAIKGTSYEYYYLFLLYSGCRRNEALSVKFSDIDYDNNLINIHGTKTEKSERQIPLFDVLKSIIGCVTRTNNGFLFNFSTSRLSDTFKTICPNHKLHDLRHTFASRCLDKGIEMKIIQQWLGHSNISTTANIYAHTSDELIKSQTELFNTHTKKDF